ncbi:MAG: ATP-binding cassette domain-containing protein [Chloroflexi bacterium]|nr:ATP-binding cassette domain-containing protein [Chloroflexota bacterium]MCI0575817.1 ATP-binding cassette domain-containing protein [Chloroflexota bacterium]MCI0646544.1 ATP-binding cassette domain-containing protein [Chloroflexota bacterium]MCI0726346.1 ATP-binding cassette domain-containing protein [Chloroflexota bacterium]
MAEPILVTKDLKKSYGDLAAVQGISFTVLRGEIFSLLGPNGAGKTTTISMLSCLLPPTAGTATINDLAIPKDALAVKQLIGVVPQEIALYDTLTGRQNLVFWGRMYGMGGKELVRRVDELLEQVNLSDRADERVSTYSGGMKRRINIGVGLLHKPQLLFMDEPTVGIDPQSRRRILDTVKELRAQGMTVLYTTHYMEEAEELSDRVGIIDHGRLIALGTQRELTQMVGEQETLRLHLGDDYNAIDAAALFQGLSGVSNSAGADGEVVLTVGAAAEALPAVIGRANDAGLRIRSVDIEEPNLEAVFLHLTGRALRD